MKPFAREVNKNNAMTTLSMAGESTTVQKNPYPTLHSGRRRGGDDKTPLAIQIFLNNFEFFGSFGYILKSVFKQFKA